MKYIHQYKGWPQFRWQTGQFADLLASVRYRQGRLLGRMEGLGFFDQSEAALATTVKEVITTSAIEGERLDQEQVRSSVARRLGVDIGALIPSDRHVDGVVEMALDATRNFGQPLTTDRLFGWHELLFPTGRPELRKIIAGKWRNDDDGPMQVVSGPMGREKVHYEAPAADRLDHEMEAFLGWCNASDTNNPLLKAGVAHLWFVTIHPFDDGNGRIARAITDMMLSRSDNSQNRFYSMSAQIEKERDAYYDILERTQKGGLDITGWLEWFLRCLDRAFDGAESTLTSVLKRARFWESHADESFNERQRKILNMLLTRFEGKLTSSKWAKLCKCSQDTAGRDINDLLRRGVLMKNPGGGRSTSYAVVE